MPATKESDLVLSGEIQIFDANDAIHPISVS